MRHAFILAIAASATFAALPASAQNFALAPAFGQANLGAGFQPTPHSVSLVAGGAVDAVNLGGACAGFIADAPDYRINYTGGLPLVFSVIAGDDTTLVINDPSGNWLCDDDSGGALNPRIQLSRALVGQYDIWVGTFGGGTADATLQIAEVGAGGGGAAATPPPAAPPAPPANPAPPAPTPAPAAAGGDAVQQILSAHNAYRNAVGVPALTWSNQLANDAQAWADHLAQINSLVHANVPQGENLWMGTAGFFSYAQMVDSWGDERQFFQRGTFPNVSTTGNWADVGHYTQVMWRGTTQVGCAKATGGGNDVLVCRYSPAGNVTGVAPF